MLAQEAAASGDNQFQATLFPPVITGVSSPDEVHGKFITSPEPVSKRGPAVRDFFDRYAHRARD